jgi:hypothetical protein
VCRVDEDAADAQNPSSRWLGPGPLGQPRHRLPQCRVLFGRYRTALVVVPRRVRTPSHPRARAAAASGLRDHTPAKAVAGGRHGAQRVLHGDGGHPGRCRRCAGASPCGPCRRRLKTDPVSPPLGSRGDRNT